MPQLSLSKWVVSKLKDTIEHSWPDDSFNPERTERFDDDVPREEV